MPRQTVWWLLYAFAVMTACDDDETAVLVASNTVAASSASTGAGGAAGSGGGGGTLGTCPTMTPMVGDTCGSIDLVCDFGGICCICSNITCAVVWECADPGLNDAACPAGAPMETQPCTGTTECSYCKGGVPELWTCGQGGWTRTDIATCP